MKKLLFAAGATAAIAWAAPALTQAAAPVAPAKQPMTRAAVAQTVQEHFTRLDTNRDGFITQAEQQAFAGQRPQRTHQRRERGEAGAMFTRLDTNRDGQVTRDEAEAAHAARMKKMAERGHGGRLFDRADANRDGAVTRAEFDAMRGHGHHRMGLKGAVRGHFGARMFAMADVNKDGRVSLHEATATSMQHFDSMDSNRDGTVTPEERRHMRHHRR